ncbi:MAG: glutamine amidotransferase [Stellaceae bacterium]
MRTSISGFDETPALEAKPFSVDDVEAGAAPKPARAPRSGENRGAGASARTVVAIRHVAYQDLGAFEEMLRARGFRVRYFDIGSGDLAAAELGEAELLVVLSGPLHAGDVDKYPFLKKEIALLETRLAAERPCLGVGLGAQLMARALGARVAPGTSHRIGWTPLTLAPAGMASPLRHLVGPVLHWHYDMLELPSGAERLAASEAGADEAFAYGRNALALQFHVESLAKKFERWLIGGAAEIAAAGVSVTRLRADTARFARIAAAQGQRCLAEWLDQLQPRR